MLVIKGGRLKRYSDEPHNSLKDGNVGVALCLYFFFFFPFLTISLNFHNQNGPLVAGGSNQGPLKLSLVFL